MKGKPGDKQRLAHILEAIAEIEKYTAGKGLEEFAANSMMLFATIKQVEIIGEAANYITRGLKAQFPAIPWKQIIGMRHILIHEYFGIDAKLVWQVIINDIPSFKNDILSIYATLP